MQTNRFPRASAWYYITPFAFGKRNLSEDSSTGKPVVFSKSCYQLVVSRPKNCIGCLLCVLASVRVAKSKLGLSDGFITVYPKGKEGFDILIDRAQKNDFEEIVKLCPRNCFSILPHES